jgi:hypothetical protein
MASGNTLLVFTARDGIPTATLGAAHAIIAGTSTPAEGLPVLAFDSSTQEYVDFQSVMPSHYSAATGVTLRILWASNSETSGHVTEWVAAFRRIEDDTDDFNTTAHTYLTTEEVVAAVPTVIGEHAWDTIEITAGTNMDGVVAGDEFILRVFRKSPTPSSGTQATGDAYLIAIEIKET